MPVVLTPKTTTAGEAAAFSASNNGLELELTHISFGIGAPYNPTGLETALVNQVVLLPIASGSRIRPQQIRVSALWQAETGTFPINEVGFWAGSTLFAVWSSATQAPLAYKTPGTDFVFFYDLALTSLPANSITVVIDPEFNQFMTALGIHMNDQDAHPQLLAVADFADAQELIWAGAAGGTANALSLSLPVDTEIAAYKAGHWFRFVAAASNSGPMTVNVAGLGVKNITKNGAEPIVGGDVQAGSIYEIVYDGVQFQLAGGVGSGSGFFEKYPHMAAPGQTVFAASYTPGNILVMVNGRDLSPGDYTATNGTSVTIPTAVAGDAVLIVAFRSFNVANTYTKPEVDALLDLAVPAGAVMPFAMATPPAGWLKANGAAVSRTTYARLFAAIGTLYGAGDGSTTFNLPDPRGEFVRALDDGRGVDPGRTIGSYQKGTAHSIDTGPTSTVVGDRVASETVPATARQKIGLDAGSAADYPADVGYYAVTATGGGGLTDAADLAWGTVRPRNVAYLYCIKV